ncbi:MAG: hypothetical protein ABIH76_02835 [Candidatus Bathyarchaeota archaeon]
MSLKKNLQKIRKELKAKSTLREKMLNNSRKITRLSKRSIMLTHQDKLVEAKKLLTEARRLLEATNKDLEGALELKSSGALFAAFQEFAEAALMLKLQKNNVFLTPEEIGVPSNAYVLGLADVVGELRRRVLDSIRKGAVEEAERCLKIMEEVYGELIILDEYVFSFLHGLRRKCDVARHLVEATRGDVIIESRRKLLEESLKNFEKRVSRC